MARQGIAGDDELKAGVWDADPVIISYDSSTRTTVLVPGVYYMTTTTNAHFLQGGSTVAATTSCNYLAAGQTLIFVVTDSTANGYMAVIKSATAGSAYIAKPNRG